MRSKKFSRGGRGQPLSAYSILRYSAHGGVKLGIRRRSLLDARNSGDDGLRDEKRSMPHEERQDSYYVSIRRLVSFSVNFLFLCYSVLPRQGRG